MTAALAARVCVAEIGGAHGLCGEVKLRSFTADPMALAHYGPLTSEDGAVTVEIEALRPGRRHLVARLRGVIDRPAAEQLANVKLYVPRNRLPAPEPDEFYHTDLIGLAAVSADGRDIGRVLAIHNFGAGDILELAPSAGGASIMLPFNDAAVPLVDIPGGRIVVEPPAAAGEEDR